MITVKLLNENVEDLLDQNEFIVDLDIHSFDHLKNLIKEAYTGSTRITNNDIGFYFKTKPLLDFHPLEHKSFYGLKDDSLLGDLNSISEIIQPGEEMPIVELNIFINVDGFFRDYEPVFTDGLLRSEGHGLFSSILNTNYDKLLKEGISATNSKQFRDSDNINVEEQQKNVNEIDEALPASMKDLSPTEREKVTSDHSKNCITPKITFIDSKTKNRIKILSDINSNDFVLVEIENYNDNMINQKGYLPKSNFDEISTFYFSFVSKYSKQKTEIEIPKSIVNEIISFKFDTMYIKESFLIENNFITSDIIKEKDVDAEFADSIDDTPITGDWETYDILGTQFEDLRTIFDPRGPITERCLNFLSVFFKTIYLIIKHSILAAIVLFNLGNFIPRVFALGLTVLNFVYTLLTDKEIKSVWSEYLKSYKMMDTEYNDIISMTSNDGEIPIYVVLQLHNNQFVKDQISDYLRKTEDFNLVESLYNLVSNDRSLNEIKLQKIKDFIKNSRLPHRIVKYPYKTVDIQSRTMVAEPDLQDTILDEFVDKFFVVMKKRLDENFYQSMQNETSESPEIAARKIKDVALDLFDRNHQLCLAFQKPLFKILVENLNFWKINNFHLKPSTMARWRVDFDLAENKRELEGEMKRIDTELNDMVHTIVSVRKSPNNYISIKNRHLIKDPLFQVNRYGNISICDLNSIFFELREGRLTLVENTTLKYRTLNEYLSHNANTSIFVTILLFPIHSLMLVFKEFCALIDFIFGFRLSKREEWFETAKNFIVNGDIVYRYIPIHWYRCRTSYVIPCYFVLFFLTLIPTYQEKLNKIMSERELLLHRINSEFEKYWETFDKNEELIMEEKRKQEENERVQQELLEAEKNDVILGEIEDNIATE